MQVFQKFHIPGSVRVGLVGIGCAVTLAACETTTTSDRYARYYDACDQNAGVCYAQCDDYEGEERSLCQSDCSEEVDQCFADVSRRAEAEQTYYSLSSSYVFYGRYGYWRPSYGYRYGPHGRRYTYAPWRDPYYSGYRRGYGYGYNHGYYGRDRDRHRDRDRDRDRSRDRDNPDRDRVTPRGRGYSNDPDSAPSPGRAYSRPKDLPRIPRGDEPSTSSTGKAVKPSSRPKTPKPLQPSRPKDTVKPKPTPSKPKSTAPKPKPTPKPVQRKPRTPAFKRPNKPNEQER